MINRAARPRHFNVPYWYLLVIPLLCYGLGIVANVVVMAANHQQMPVLVSDCLSHQIYWHEAEDTLHTCLTPATRLKFLADWIYIRGVGTASLGDFFEWVYDFFSLPLLFVWVVLVVKDSNGGASGRGPR